MLRVSNIPLGLDDREEAALERALKALHVPASRVIRWHISKKSVDARDKSSVRFVTAVDVALKDENRVPLNDQVRRVEPPRGLTPPRVQAPVRPVVVGFGPGGLFAALMLARAGLKPIVLERGERVEERAVTTARFADTGDLDPESNIQFGEGGAGAFSDGKLTTGINSPHCAAVLTELYRHGAPEEIMYLARPHVGTDKLPGVVKSIREEIVSLGGEVRFRTRLTGIGTDRGHISAVKIQSPEGNDTIETDTCVIAIGHSASDTQQMLYRAGVNMLQKPFSVGARIEHPQTLINRSQYGAFAEHPKIGAAEYHLSCKLPDGRGAYTFCMCPGGTVVPAASRIGGVCTNGMSRFARDGENANAALLVDVRTEDFGDDHPLAGYVLQRLWEERAFRAGGGNYRAPSQLSGDLLRGVQSKAAGSVRPTYRPGVEWGDLRAVLPAFAADGIGLAIAQFDRRLHGFAMPDAVLTGVEARSSCPVRVPRNEHMECNIGGLYPCGEGAGQAGGIMSAAVDGIRVAEAVIAYYGGTEP